MCTLDELNIITVQALRTWILRGECTGACTPVGTHSPGACLYLFYAYRYLCFICTFGERIMLQSTHRCATGFISEWPTREVINRCDTCNYADDNTFGVSRETMGSVQENLKEAGDVMMPWYDLWTWCKRTLQNFDTCCLLRTTISTYARFSSKMALLVSEMCSHAQNF